MIVTGQKYTFIYNKSGMVKIASQYLDSRKYPRLISELRE